MPRQGRQKSASKIYHVMIRGNERREIFLADEDRRCFIDILRKKNEEKKYSLYAFCLMDNHVHFLINEGEDRISQIMKRINVTYVYYFNKKYKRVGHLLQDRFKSEIIDADSYLLAAVRYIHNNPVKAGVASHPQEYPWSSYHLYEQNETGGDIIDKQGILDIFSDNREEAIKRFRAFSRQANEDHFVEVEYNEKETINKPIRSDSEARLFIADYLKKRNVSLPEIKSEPDVRNELVLELKKRTDLSVRQMADLLSIGRNIVQRIKCE